MIFSTQSAASSLMSSLPLQGTDVKEEMKKLSHKIKQCEEALNSIDQQLAQKDAGKRKSNLLIQKDQKNEEMWGYQHRWLVLKQQSFKSTHKTQQRRLNPSELQNPSIRHSPLDFTEIEKAVDAFFTASLLNQEVKTDLLKTEEEIINWTARLNGLRETATRGLIKKNQETSHLSLKKYINRKTLFFIIFGLGSLILFYKNRVRLLSYVHKVFNLFTSSKNPEINPRTVNPTQTHLSLPTVSTVSSSTTISAVSPPTEQQLRAEYDRHHKNIRFFIKSKGHSLEWCLRHGPKISQDLYNWIRANGKMKKHW